MVNAADRMITGCREMKGIIIRVDSVVPDLRSLSFLIEDPDSFLLEMTAEWSQTVWSGSLNDLENEKVRIWEVRSASSLGAQLFI